MADYEATLHTKDTKVDKKAGKSSSASTRDHDDELLEVMDTDAPAAAPTTAAPAEDPQAAQQKKDHDAEELAKKQAAKLDKFKEKEQAKALKKKKEEAEKRAADGVKLTHTGEHDLKRAIDRANGRVHRHYEQGKANVWDEFKDGTHRLQESPGGRAAIRAARSVRDGETRAQSLRAAEQDRIASLKKKTEAEEAEIKRLNVPYATSDGVATPYDVASAASDAADDAFSDEDSDDSDPDMLMSNRKKLLQNQFDSMMQKLGQKGVAKAAVKHAAKFIATAKMQKLDQKATKHHHTGHHHAHSPPRVLDHKDEEGVDEAAASLKKFVEKKGPNPLTAGIQPEAKPDVEAAPKPVAQAAVTPAAKPAAKPDVIAEQASEIAALKKKIAALKAGVVHATPPEKMPSTAQVIAADASNQDLYHQNAAKDFDIVHRTMIGVHDKEWKAEAQEEKEVHDAKAHKWQVDEASVDATSQAGAAAETDADSKPLWNEVWHDYHHPSPNTKPIRDRLHLVHPDEPRTGYNGAQGIKRSITAPSSTLVLPGDKA